MKLLADYHVHSKNCKFFHAKNSIEEMAYAANAMGLQEIAITDHGFRHLCGTNKQKLKKAREVIDEINTWSTTKVLLGIEADIIAEDGTIDVDNETLTMIDILVVGYHKLIKTDFASYFGKTDGSKEAKDRCTRAFVNAINRYPVNIISHLDSVLTTDLYEVGKACRERGTMVEINNRHTKWNQDQVDELIASGCIFVVNSDAHCREDIGVVDKAFDIIKKYNIPSECVANVEFEYEEKSENDKQTEVAFSLYRKKQEELAKEQEEKQEKKRYEYTESLSPEMEKALAEIAKEQGLNYVNKNDVQEESVESVFDFNLMTPEEIEIIKQAQEVLARLEEEKAAKAEEAPAEPTTATDADEVVLDEESRRNELETTVETEQVPVSEPVKLVEEPEIAEALEEKPTQSAEKKPSSVDDILRALANVKESQANIKDESAPKQKIVMKIEKNAPTTKKATASGGKPKIVDVDVESMAKKPEKPAEPKAAKPKKNLGGFIGGAGGMVGLAEDNQKKASTSKSDK